MNSLTYSYYKLPIIGKAQSLEQTQQKINSFTFCCFLSLSLLGQSSAGPCSETICDSCVIKLEGIHYTFKPNPFCVFQKEYEVQASLAKEKRAAAEAIFFIWGVGENRTTAYCKKIRSRTTLSSNDSLFLEELSARISCTAKAYYSEPYYNDFAMMFYFYKDKEKQNKLKWQAKPFNGLLSIWRILQPIFYLDKN